MRPDEIQVVGKWRVRGRVGQGGFSWVFEVVDDYLRIPRALKLLKPEASRGIQYERFWQEAQLLAGLSEKYRNGHLVNVFELDQDRQTGCFYYVMELLSGNDLGHLLRERGPLALDEIRRIFLGALEGLGVLHADVPAPIIHRDIKPGNIWITGDGEAKVIDLGIAKRQQTASPQGEETIVGDAGQATIGPGDGNFTTQDQFIGTVKYASPEHLMLEPLTPATDVWAMGLCLHQALTGRHPYDGLSDLTDATNYATVSRFLMRLQLEHTELRLDLPAGVPRAVQEVIRRALQVDPRKRYRDANEMRTALARAFQRPASQEEVRPRPTPIGDTPNEKERARVASAKAPLYAALGVAAAIALLTGVWWINGPSVSPGDLMRARESANQIDEKLAERLRGNDPIWEDRAKPVRSALSRGRAAEKADEPDVALLAYAEGERLGRELLEQIPDTPPAPPPPPTLSEERVRAERAELQQSLDQIESRSKASPTEATTLQPYRTQLGAQVTEAERLMAAHDLPGALKVLGDAQSAARELLGSLPEALPQDQEPTTLQAPPVGVAEVKIAREAAASARTEADKAGADELGKPDWKTAVAAFREGEKASKSKEFAQAKESFDRASTNFAKARDAVRPDELVGFQANRAAGRARDLASDARTKLLAGVSSCSGLPLPAARPDCESGEQALGDGDAALRNEGFEDARKQFALARDRYEAAGKATRDLAGAHAAKAKAIAARAELGKSCGDLPTSQAAEACSTAEASFSEAETRLNARDGARAVTAFETAESGYRRAKQLEGDTPGKPGKADSHAIRETLQKCEEAMVARDIDELRLWWRLSSAKSGVIEGLFGMGSLTARFTIQGEPVISGERATARVRKFISVEQPDGERATFVDETVNVAFAWRSDYWQVVDGL